MKRFSLSGLSLGVLLTFANSHAYAQLQYPSPLPSNRPAVSPWLQLNRPGASPAENYYNLVQPQFQFGAGIQSLQSQSLANRGAINGLEGGLYGYTTGHRSGFMTQSRYFMNNGSGAAGAGGAYRGPAYGNRAYGGMQNPGAAFGGGYGLGQGYSGVGQGYGAIGQGYSAIGQSNGQLGLPR